MPAYALLAPPAKTAAPATPAPKTAARPVVAPRTVARPTAAAPLAQRQHLPALAPKVPARSAPNALAATAGQLLGQLPAFAQKKAAAAAHDFDGYPLLTVLLGYDPFAHQVVDRTPRNLVYGFLALTPNGVQQLQDLEQSGGLRLAFDWLRAEAQRRQLSVQRVQSLLQDAWTNFHFKDALLHPIDTAERLVAPFEQLGKDVVAFGKAAFARVLEFVFTAVLGEGASTVLRILRKAGDTYRLILRNPLRFAGYLVKAGKEGFELFYAHLGQHLKKGLTNWLMGSLQGGGLVLPERFDGPGLLSLALQALGLTYDYVRGKIVNRVGEPAVQRIEQAVHLGNTLLTKGLGAAAQEMGGLLGEFVETALGSLREWVTTTVVGKAVTKLASLLLPAAALLEAVHSTYTTVMFFIERARQLGEVVTAFLDSVATIAAGKTTDAARKVEGVMSGLVPLIIGFLASLVGLDKLSGAIRNLLKKLRKPVDLLINKLVDFVLKLGKKALGAAQQAAGTVMGWFGTRQKFTQPNGETHTLFFEGSPQQAELMMASRKMKVLQYLHEREVRLQKTTPPTTEAEKKALDDERREIGPAKQHALALHNKAVVGEDQLQDHGSSMANELRELSIYMARVGGLDVTPASLAGADPDPTAPYPIPLPPKAEHRYGDDPKTSEIHLVSTATSKGANLSDANAPNGWRLLQRAGHTAKTAWSRMHLVSQKLGGQPDDRNLVPAPSSQNLGEVLNFEAPLKELIEATTLVPATTPRRRGVPNPPSTTKPRKDPSVLWITTSVSFHADADSEREIIDWNATPGVDQITIPPGMKKPWFAKTVDFKAGTYIYDPDKPGQPWRKEPSVRFALTAQIPRPTFDKNIPVIPSIYSIGAPTIAERCQCSPEFARLVKLVQKLEGKTHTVEDFRILMKGSRGKTQYNRIIGDKLFNDDLTTVVAALNEEKVIKL